MNSTADASMSGPVDMPPSSTNKYIADANDTFINNDEELHMVHMDVTEVVESVLAEMLDDGRISFLCGDLPAMVVRLAAEAAASVIIAHERGFRDR